MTEVTAIKWAALSERERDALVAEKVLGWRPVMVRARGETNTVQVLASAIPPRDGVWSHEQLEAWSIPWFTTDIAAAWTVIERLQENGLYVAVSKPAKMLTWDVRGWNEETNDNRFIAHSESAPEAICLAALRACGVPVEE